MLNSLLIANRGEIARRIIRTARRMGIRTVAVFTEADRSWPHWREADEAVQLDSGPAADGYVSIDGVMAAALSTGAEAIHPGYGFLSEDPRLAEACEAAGLAFVGPPAAAIRVMGSKSAAKQIMAGAGVPVVPGYNGERQEADFLKRKAYELGYPVLLKAVQGGGGRGMRRVARALDFDAALAAARREAEAAFGDERMLVERCIACPRHIEVQIFADAHGDVVHLFERDCSVQRRYQKLIEEAPAPGLPDAVRAAVGEAAVAAARAVAYRGAGTVEFLADSSNGLRPDGIFFMEMNTRLQVEHPVTEAITGIDLVEWQLRVAAGERLPLRQGDIGLAGHAIEARICAEDVLNGFSPATGRIWSAAFPSGPGIRIDSGVADGVVVGPHYDSLLAKVICSGADRAEALARLADALANSSIAGPRTNIAFLSAIVSHPEMVAGGVGTDFLERELAVLAGPALPVDAAAGAIAACLEREAAEHARNAAGPWRRCDAFRLAGASGAACVEAEIEGEPVEVDVVWQGGRPQVMAIDGAAVTAIDGTRIVWGSREAFVLFAGQQLHVGFPDPLVRGIASTKAGGEVVVPMPGRISTLAVGLGDWVAAGDLLFTLEAMKMEHDVAAPVEGRIQAMHVGAGMQVERGAVALVIDTAGAAAAPQAVD